MHVGKDEKVHQEWNRPIQLYMSSTLIWNNNLNPHPQQHISTLIIIFQIK